MKGQFLNRSSWLMKLYQFRTDQYQTLTCLASGSDLLNPAMKHTDILPLTVNLIFSICVWIWFSYPFYQMWFNSGTLCSLCASARVWTCTSSSLRTSAASFVFSFFLLLSCWVEFRSIFRGGKEPCCWVDLVSTNIRELLINHGCSTQWGAVGVTVFVSGCVNHTMSITLYSNKTSQLCHTPLRNEKEKRLSISCALQPQTTSSISCAPLASLSYKESF